jgi:hypothetical protein
MVACRVTRLGEFSFIGRSITLGSILKVTKVTKVLCYFFRRRDYELTLTKNWFGLPTFWANFSQTHLVTLVTCKTLEPPIKSVVDSTSQRFTNMLQACEMT